MANGAADAGPRLGYGDGFGDSCRTSIQQNGAGPGVKVLPRPRHELASFLAGSPVAAGRAATCRANKLRLVVRRLSDFLAGDARGSSEQKT
jgi:hypothetical protein